MCILDAFYNKKKKDKKKQKEDNKQLNEAIFVNVAIFMNVSVICRKGNRRKSSQLDGKIKRSRQGK